MLTDAWWFLQPSNVMFLLLLLAFFAALLRLRALSGFLLFLSLMIIALPTVFGAADWLGWQLERQYPPARVLPAHVDGIIVLGGSVQWDISEQHGQLNLNAAGERMVAAAALARRYPQAQLVLTGLFRETIPSDFRTDAQPRSLFTGPEFGGRPLTFIGAARSTYEEGLLTLETVQPAAGQTWLLVTSAMHMPRAEGVFHTLGWTSLIPYPVDYRAPASPRLLNLNLNIGEQLQRFDDAVREWAALIVYRNTGRIR
jgi:uncharacterized SAM-binding protein YcdF (DUF218 family)